MLVRLLSMSGHRVERAPDGRAAWEKISKNVGQFDVLITDHNMPHMDGLGLVRHLRQAAFPGRIIVHSIALFPSDRDEYRALSVDRVIPKTTDAAELLNAVDSFCGT